MVSKGCPAATPAVPPTAPETNSLATIATFWLSREGEAALLVLWAVISIPFTPRSLQDFSGTIDSMVEPSLARPHQSISDHTKTAVSDVAITCAYHPMISVHSRVSREHGMGAEPGKITPLPLWSSARSRRISQGGASYQHTPWEHQGLAPIRAATLLLPETAAARNS